MPDFVRIGSSRLASFEIERGTLQDVLFAYGVEFPCGGRGSACAAGSKLIAGDAGDAGRAALLRGSASRRAGGWPAMRGRRPVTLDIAQWDAAILADDSIFEFTPCEGLGLQSIWGPRHWSGNCRPRNGTRAGSPYGTEPAGCLGSGHHDPGASSR